MAAPTLIDRWQFMLLCLAGQAMPIPPALPGRRHQPLAVPDAPDEVAASWERKHGVWTPPAEPPRFPWMTPA